MAMRLASAPPDVNAISRGRAPSRAAIVSRASSRSALAARPGAWRLEGFPAHAERARSTASRTSGRTGLVALWSR
jgi:hypothetical protein